MALSDIIEASVIQADFLSLGITGYIMTLTILIFKVSIIVISRLYVLLIYTTHSFYTQFIRKKFNNYIILN